MSYCGCILNVLPATCLTVRCDCGEQLDHALQMIARARRGVGLYLRQEGRGIGLLDKLRASNLQDEGLDTVEAKLKLGHQPDERDYTVAALMIRDLGIRSVDLITNNPKKINELRGLGIAVRNQDPSKFHPCGKHQLPSHQSQAYGSPPPPEWASAVCRR